MKFKAWIGLPLLGLAACSEPRPDCGQLPAEMAVGNAGCLIAQDGAVVLVQQRVSGKWALPGGTAETGERAACTAARETHEETGLQVRVIQHLVELDNGFHVFRCEAERDGQLQPADGLEISQAAWKRREERAGLAWRFPEYRQQTEQLIEIAD